MKRDDWKIWGNAASRRMFVQLVDEHDGGLMDSEVAALRDTSGTEDFCIAALPVGDWNRDLTPWPAPPVFGKQPFGEDAPKTLAFLLEEALPAIGEAHPAEERTIALCGYSLAGLFALWAVCRTDRFSGAVAGSPSVWYPGWTAYAASHPFRAPLCYLSLGDREERTRNPVMAAVGGAIREQYRLLAEQGVHCRLDWNPGNHFADSDRRMARGMAWMLEEWQRAENQA